MAWVWCPWLRTKETSVLSPKYHCRHCGLAETRKTPTEALDDSPRNAPGTRPAKLGHGVCMPACVCTCVQGTCCGKQWGHCRVGRTARPHRRTSQCQNNGHPLSNPSSLSMSKFYERDKAKLNVNYFHEQKGMEMGWILMNPRNGYVVEWKT